MYKALVEHPSRQLSTKRLDFPRPKKMSNRPTKEKRITQGRAGNRTRVARTRSAHTTPILLSRAGVSQDRN